MKTLLIAPELFLAEGGIARILRAYLHALIMDSAAGDTVGAVVLNDSPASQGRMPGYLRAQPPAFLHASNRRKLDFSRACLHHGTQADRIVCGHIHQAALARAAQVRNPRLRYYIVAHGIEVWRPYNFNERHVLRHAHRILCVSEYTRRQMLRFMPTLHPEQVVIVPNTLDPDFALPTPPPLPVGPGPRILSVGRLTTDDTYKGFDTLIESMPLVRENLPTASLRIAGGGNDETRLRELAAQHGGPGVVDLLGRISDAQLREEYERCDLFALPSRKEGFGLVYLEAMSYGKPCLAARAGGAPEVVDHQVGELVHYGHLDEIADAIVRLAARRPEPEKIRGHLAQFSFNVFRERLKAALTPAS